MNRISARDRYRTRLLGGLAALLVAPLMAGCGTVDVEHAASEGPPLDLYEFFDSSSQAWGIVQDWRGGVVRQFVAKIDGRVTDGQLVLEEEFVFADGERSTRRWNISRNGDGSFEGTANDIVGVARGESHGNALRWRYAMDLTYKGRELRVRFDDRLWRVDDDVLINRAAIRKFGIVVGEVTLFIRRVGA